MNHQADDSIRSKPASKRFQGFANFGHFQLHLFAHEAQIFHNIIAFNLLCRSYPIFAANLSPGTVLHMHDFRNCFPPGQT